MSSGKIKSPKRTKRKLRPRPQKVTAQEVKTAHKVLTSTIKAHELAMLKLHEDGVPKHQIINSDIVHDLWKLQDAQEILKRF